MSTFGTIKSAVQVNLGGRNDSTTNSSIQQAYNTVIKILSVKNNWPEMETETNYALTLNQYQVTPTNLNAVNCRQELSFQIFDGTRFFPALEYLTPREWDDKVRPSLHVSVGRPRYWTKFAGSYYVAPKANLATYVLYLKYIAKPTLATGDASVVPFIDLDEAIIAAVTGMVLMSMEELELASSWLKLASPIFKEYGIDSQDITNFKPSSAVIHGLTNSQSWSDPFARR